MIFSSWQYLLFLPIVVFLYWRTQGKARMLLLIAASYFFYMSWLPAYGLLLFVLSTVSWALGLLIHKALQADILNNSGAPRDHVAPRQISKAKLLMIAGLIINLGCLAYYKYANWILSNIFNAFNKVLHLFGLHEQVIPQASWPLLNIILPLGISFFVFEFVHYLVDVYKGDKPVKSWMEFSVFASFFPSQIAGPIKRYQDFVLWTREPLPLTTGRFYEAMTLIVQGLFKKVAIADPIGVLVYPAFASASLQSVPDALIASIGFTIQVYCDFSGYTDIGRGSALLFGIRLPENFRLPYLAHDLADFWRRWHMSLSYWLRDYVYIPLGGSRKSFVLNSRNLLTTMVVCGLWHGVGWHYVIFGLFQGLGLVVHREWALFARRHRWLDSRNSTAGKWFGTFLTMAFITFTYTIFRAPNMSHAWNVILGLFSNNFQTALFYPLIKASILPVLAVYMTYWLVSVYQTRRLIRAGTVRGAIESEQYSEHLKWSEGVRPLVFPLPLRLASWTAAMLVALAARPTEAVPFVYFQF